MYLFIENGNVTFTPGIILHFEKKLCRVKKVSILRSWWTRLSSGRPCPWWSWLTTTTWWRVTIGNCFRKAVIVCESVLVWSSVLRRKKWSVPRSALIILEWRYVGKESEWIECPTNRFSARRFSGGYLSSTETRDSRFSRLGTETPRLSVWVSSRNRTRQRQLGSHSASTLSEYPNGISFLMKQDFLNTSR